MRPSLTQTLFVAALPFLTTPAFAESVALQMTRIVEWKAVYGQVEARDRIPARVRLGGTLVDLTVVEGDLVAAGQPIAVVIDEKLAFQLSALAAQKAAISAQLTNAETELKRGEDLLRQGVTTAQGLDALRTQVAVLKGQISGVDAQSALISQQKKEGVVLAPADGRVLDVPVAKGAVVMPGEVIATLGGGGTYLRLSIPERHAASLHEGDAIEIAEGGSNQTGKLSRIYPLIQNGRVIADVEIAGLTDSFVDARVLVRLPVDKRDALMVPAAALSLRAGLDFVRVEDSAGVTERSVVPGERQIIDGVAMVEILSGLHLGDRVIPDAPASADDANE